MYKKISLFFVLFLILGIINVCLAVSLHDKNKKEAYTSQLLSEIGQDAPQPTGTQHSAAPLVLGAYEAQMETSDARATNLRIFLRKYDSPLYDYADFIVKTSDKYGFDYRLLVAIAMQESTLCKFIPPNSYNCWGYGIYGDTVTKFSGYEEAIDTVAKGLKEDYLDHGLVTASQIMKKYTPPSQGSWQVGVNNALKWIEQ